MCEEFLVFGFGTYKDSAPTELRQSPFATIEMNQQTGVTQDLELLTDSCPVFFIYGVIPDVAACSRFCLSELSGWSFSSSRVKA